MYTDIYNLSKLKQDQISNLNKRTSPSEIEALVERYPTKKGPGTDGFSAEVYQVFKKELIMPKLLKSFYKT